MGGRALPKDVQVEGLGYLNSTPGGPGSFHGPYSCFCPNTSGLPPSERWCCLGFSVPTTTPCPCPSQCLHGLHLPGTHFPKQQCKFASPFLQTQGARCCSDEYRAGGHHLKAPYPWVPLSPAPASRLAERPLCPQDFSNDLLPCSLTVIKKCPRQHNSQSPQYGASPRAHQ